MGYWVNYYCISHIGKIRDINQDNFCCDEKHIRVNNYSDGEVVSGKSSVDKGAAFAVFDGMGGEQCGEIASLIASEEMSLYNFFPNAPQKLKQFCKLSNGKICNYIDENALSSMGTTAAILAFHKNKVHLCNIGDSKIFCFSQKGLEQISFDHVYKGECKGKPPLTQNLGIKEDELIIAPYIEQFKLCDGQKYIICSDGLTDMVENDEIERIMKREKDENIARVLLGKALENGGRDNITIIFLSLQKEKISHLIKRIFKHNTI